MAGSSTSTQRPSRTAARETAAGISPSCPTNALFARSRARHGRDEVYAGSLEVSLELVDAGELGHRAALFLDKIGAIPGIIDVTTWIGNLCLMVER
jgi:hypothetical protein